MSAAPSGSIAEAYEPAQGVQPGPNHAGACAGSQRPARRFRVRVGCVGYAPAQRECGLPAQSSTFAAGHPRRVPRRGDGSFYPVEAGGAHGFTLTNRATSREGCVLSRDRAAAHDAHALWASTSARPASGSSTRPTATSPGRADRYELPDFGRQPGSGVSIPAVANRPFLFVEDEDTFHLWRDRVGQQRQIAKYALVHAPTRRSCALEFSDR